MFFRRFVFWSIPPIFFQVFAVIAPRLPFTVALFSESFFARIFSIYFFCANFLNLLLGRLSKLLYSPVILKIMTFFYSQFFYFVFFVVFCSGRIFVVLLGFTVFCFGVYTPSYWFEGPWRWEILTSHDFMNFTMFCKPWFWYFSFPEFLQKFLLCNGPSNSNFPHSHEYGLMWRLAFFLLVKT